MPNFVVIPASELPEVGALIMTVDQALPALLSRARDQKVLAYRMCGTRSGRAISGEAWFGGRSRPADVGDVARENGIEIEDMAGNLWQWTDDLYDDVAVRGAFAVNPVGPAKAQFQVVRGGSFNNDPDNLRAAYRGIDGPGYRGLNIGLRLFAVPSTPKTESQASGQSSVRLWRTGACLRESRLVLLVFLVEGRPKSVVPRPSLVICLKASERDGWGFFMLFMKTKSAGVYVKDGRKSIRQLTQEVQALQ